VYTTYGLLMHRTISSTTTARPARTGGRLLGLCSTGTKSSKFGFIRCQTSDLNGAARYNEMGRAKKWTPKASPGSVTLANRSSGPPLQAY
jgi:hypothetical protein